MIKEPMMVSRCGLAAITQNLRFWEKNKYVVIFSTVGVPDVSGAWSPTDIVKSVDSGGVVTLVNSKDKSKVVVSLSDMSQEGGKALPYSYSYSSLITCKEKSPVKSYREGLLSYLKAPHE